MSEFFSHLASSFLLTGLAAMAGLMLLHFCAQYLMRGLLVRSRLRRLTLVVKQHNDVPRQQVKEKLAAIFRGTRVDFAWTEFEETLHEQHVWKDGERVVADVRATVPAEAFFNGNTAVDPWLATESSNIFREF